MKKINLVIIFAILTIGLLVTRVAAIDMNLVNSITQNNINSAENLSTGNSVTNPFAQNSIENNSITAPLSNSLQNSAVDISTIYSQSSEDTFGAREIIDILLIVVGVLIILLGIAILIRTNR